MALSVKRSETQPPPNERDAWAEEIVRGARERSVGASVREMAAFLQDLLGQKLTAAATGVDAPRAVGAWARGEQEPTRETERRLREVFEVATLLVTADSPQTAQSWFMGRNPHLRDRAPIVVYGEDATGGARVMQAARAFLAHG